MIFLDSSFLIGHKIENDSNHERAARLITAISKGNYGRPVISDYIFDEVVTAILNKGKKLALAIETGNELKNSVEIFDVTESDFEEAWKLFKNQKNTTLSFTDCTTISIMRSRRIQTVATFDGELSKIDGIIVAMP